MKLINRDTKVMVQGITGTQGRFHAARMKEYGTRVVAGVTPGRGGQDVDGTPVYDTVVEAKEVQGCDASIIFVPAFGALDAALEAIEAGMNPVVVITEGIPVRDTIEIVARAKQLDTTVVGPNTPGLIKAGESKMGIMPNQVFKRGSVGIISRSGTLFYEIAAHVTNQDLGESTCVGLGGDPVVGLDYIDFIASGGFTKPVAAYIAGRAAIPGKRMGHAGAIIQGAAGTADSKINALRGAGATIGEQPIDVAKALKRALF
jgi:succinyl-CoA synthetase alpha subunit